MAQQTLARPIAYAFPPSTEKKATAKHVTSLDGLRAVAVIAVIFFHAGVPGFEAGFLGVDLFFVLSGFLITTLLAGEWLKHGTIRLGQFFSRRVKRLMPALLVMVLAVTTYTVIVISSARTAIRGDALSALFYVANWHFIETDSYSQATGSPSPLQPTWSLSIEEQFYFVWPLILVAVLALLARRQLKIAALIAGAGAACCAVLAIYNFDRDLPTFSYMATQTRAFEPLLGAAAALALVAWPRFSESFKRHRALPAAVAVCVLIGGFFLLRPIDGDSSRYGLGGNVIFAIAATVLVACLWYGPWRFEPTALLRWRPLVLVGVISYGVYLWHWPMLLFISDGDDGPAWTRAVAIGVAVLVAVASYFFIELPVRGGRLGEWLGNGLRLFTVAVMALATTAAAVVFVSSPLWQ